MFVKLFVRLLDVSPTVKGFIWKQWYQHLAGYHIPDWTFMNYGFMAVDEKPLVLDPDDEVNRYFIQLYHHVATGTDLKNLNVLEVGSGRGGGASYVTRYLGPHSVTGLDFSKKAILFSQKHHASVKNLTFQQGNAEALPFANHSFDVVMNVESSHCYGCLDKFLNEVCRVLKPGGFFLFADFRSATDLNQLNKSLAETGMTIIRQTNITPFILCSLDLDHKRKQKLIHSAFKKHLLHSFEEFAGLKGSQIYEAFVSGKMIYHSYVMKSPG
ncbi:MAG: class I SAM-dependent methyltransferase [Verrucomicrobiota bacterium]|nr:class I SAM-dependent methyltransferase [Verrucomicrobiota bacterium]